MSASVDPARGGEIGVGSYRLELAREDDGATLVTVRQVAADDGEGKDRLRGFSLASAKLAVKQPMGVSPFAMRRMRVNATCKGPTSSRRERENV
jgi:hypothetical protein